jgi:1-deoxy-D-xylulose-5-phosphate reductoisomerase
LRKNIAILGSTGSIGCNALEVIAHLGEPYRAVALSAHSQGQKLIEQVQKHRPQSVAITDERVTDDVVRQIRSLGAQVHLGGDGLVKLATRDDVDIVLASVVGAAGLPAVLAAVQAGKTLALANKESLVVAGSLLIPEARKRGVKILPVDSEHSAVFQAMQCGRAQDVRRVILTASGGPFRCASVEQIETATLADALNHPTWRMGNKITIDSATMFNKGLEIIEARWLFDIPASKIEVVIHPESIIHSMVEYVDGSVIAQLSPPDMRTPIQYALTYPERAEGISRRLDLSGAFKLHFEPPDPRRFPALRIAFDVAERGGTLGAVMNAANEAAVAAFVAGQIPFGEISRLVELTIAQHRLQHEPTLDDLLEADQWARRTVQTIVSAPGIVGAAPLTPSPSGRGLG